MTARARKWKVAPALRRRRRPATLRSVLRDLARHVPPKDKGNISGERDRLAHALWGVLTALRGPDSGAFSVQGDESITDHAVKDATTAVIRRHVFGECRYAHSAPDSEGRAALRRKLGASPFNHFLHHARHAFEALGLKWDEVNHHGRAR